jgi:hypothetical protein
MTLLASGSYPNIRHTVDRSQSNGDTENNRREAVGLDCRLGFHPTPERGRGKMAAPNEQCRDFQPLEESGGKPYVSPVENVTST